MFNKISILFYAIIIASLSAKSQNWVIYNTQNSGLPANEVLSVTQDNEGNKWIGTYWGGVAKFDNQHWTVYTDTNSAMPHYTVRTVAVDGDNNKWFGTPAGVAKFDGNNFTVYNTTNSPLPSDFINVIVPDGDHKIWIGTNNGLAKYDGQDWTVYTTSNSALQNNYIQSLDESDDGVIWVATYSGLSKFDSNDNQWTNFNPQNSDLPEDEVYAIGEKENGKIWVRTFSSLVCYNDNSNNWTIYDTITLGQPNSFCRTIPFDSNDHFWIGGDQGLVRVHTDNGSIQDNEYFNASNSGLPNNGVITLFVDRMNNLWSGVSLGNLAVFNPDGVDLTAIAEQQIGMDFMLSPNPAAEYSNLNFELSNSETILFEAFDLSGRKMMPDVMKHFQAGNNRYSFQTSALTPGIYFLKLSAGSRSSVAKFIVSR